MSHPYLGPVLAIDDNPAMLSVMTRELSRWRRVISCRTPDEALRAVEPWGHHPAAVIADVSLGGWPDGIELVRQVRERVGPVPALLLSGHATLATDAIERLAALRPSVGFATKHSLRNRVVELMEMISIVDPGIATDATDLANAVRDLAARFALTLAERRLLAVALKGERRCELAERLDTNVHTLKSRIRRILRKTGHRDLRSLRRALLSAPTPG